MPATNLAISCTYIDSNSVGTYIHAFSVIKFILYPLKINYINLYEITKLISDFEPEIE